VETLQPELYERFHEEAETWSKLEGHDHVVERVTVGIMEDGPVSILLDHSI
jgi:hypothetical protein